MFKEVADIKTSDQLHLPVPEAKFETVVAKPSDLQKEMVAGVEQTCCGNSLRQCGCVCGQYALRHQRWAQDWSGRSPDESHAPDDPNSKLNVCVQNVLKIWEEGKDQKLTKLLFATSPPRKTMAISMSTMIFAKS